MTFNQKKNEEILKKLMAEDPKVPDIIKYFGYDHLPERLQAISKPIYDLAMLIYITTDQCAEQSAGFRKLLEAKDCFVRAAL